MLDGFAYCRMLFDETDGPVTCLSAVNPAFDRLTGLKDVVGKHVTDVIPASTRSAQSVRDMRTGGTDRPEALASIDFTPLDMWLSIFLYSPRRITSSPFSKTSGERKRAGRKRTDCSARFKTRKKDWSDSSTASQRGLVRGQSEEVRLGKRGRFREFGFGRPTRWAWKRWLQLPRCIARLSRGRSRAPPLRALAGEVVRNQEEVVRSPSTGELRHRLVNATPVRDAPAISSVRFRSFAT